MALLTELQDVDGVVRVRSCMDSLLATTIVMEEAKYGDLNGFMATYSSSITLLDRKVLCLMAAR